MIDDEDLISTLSLARRGGNTPVRIYLDEETIHRLVIESGSPVQSAPLKFSGLPVTLVSGTTLPWLECEGELCYPFPQILGT